MPTARRDLRLRRSPVWVLVGGLVLVAGAIGIAIWHAHHPTPLPTSTRTVSASTPVDEPVYVGMTTGVEGRTLALSGVKVHTTSNTEVSITPLLCRGGRIEATSDPAPFCVELINPEGQTLRLEDSIVLEVVGDAPAVAVIDAVQLGFRENLQWGTFPTGASAVIRVLSR